jgi:hypothetical protein
MKHKKTKKVLKSVILKRERKMIKRKEKELWNQLREKVKYLQDNRCYYPNCNLEIFGKSAHIHHIISRDIKEFKYDILNLILLCPRHHKLSPLSVHQTSIYFSDILRNKEPERYYYLLNKLENYIKVKL